MLLAVLAVTFLVLAGVTGWQQWAAARRLAIERRAAEPVSVEAPAVVGEEAGGPNNTSATTGQGGTYTAGSPGANGTVGGEPAGVMYVHVAGAVQNPGVYQLPAAARVINAIDAAGGAKPDAMTDALNLALPLRDGDKVYVPTRKEVSWHCSPPGAPVSGISNTAGGKSIVNINTATRDELDSLPGIGPSLADRIIAYRSEHGPFKDVKDLLNVSGIGESRLQDLAPYITVR